MQVRYLFEAGNVFRSITRTERAHCTLNVHIEHVFLMKAVYVWEGWSAIQYEVIWLMYVYCEYVWLCVL